MTATKTRTKKVKNKGGRPGDPKIARLMKKEGLTRQGAWYRLHVAGGVKRPVGRPWPEKKAEE